jgi:hypothetical protein
MSHGNPRVGSEIRETILALVVFSYFFNLVMFSLALGVTYFVFYLYRAFKGGVMESPFKILTLSMGLLTFSLTCSLVGFFLNLGNLSLVQQSGEIAFLVLGLIGFYKLYAFWRFDFVSQIRNIDASFATAASPAETSDGVQEGSLP